MTPEIEKKRRELFESKFPPPYYVTWNLDRKGYYSIHRDSTRKRGSENYDATWQGFNAALDAVEIELPKRPKWKEKYELSGVPVRVDLLLMEGEDCGITKCKLAIDRIGLGLKVK